jgi:hypothetical protein
MDTPILRVAARYRILTAFGIRDFEKLMKKASSFGILSAYRGELSKSDNKQRHGQLIADLQTMGFRNVETIKSHWEDMSTHVTHKEQSVLVPRIGFKSLIELGDKYKQDAVIYKDPSGTIGIYDNRGEVELAFDPEGDAAVALSLQKDEYSKGRSLSFGLQLVPRKFRYQGAPITRDKLVQELQR